VYSFGVMLWEIVTGLVPTRGGLTDVTVPDECPAEIADLIQARSFVMHCPALASVYSAYYVASLVLVTADDCKQMHRCTLLSFCVHLAVTVGDGRTSILPRMCECRPVLAARDCNLHIRAQFRAHHGLQQLPCNADTS